MNNNFKLYIFFVSILAHGVHTLAQDNHTAAQDSHAGAQSTHAVMPDTRVLAGGRFILHGKLSGPAPAQIWMYCTGINGRQKVDSCALKNGVFVFSGALNEPGEAYLTVRKKVAGTDESNGVSIYLEAASMELIGEAADLRKAVLTGSVSQDEFNALQQEYAPVRAKEQPLLTAYNKANNAYIAAMQAKLPDEQLTVLRDTAANLHDLFGPFQDLMDEITFRFFSNHPNSFVTACMLKDYAGLLTLDSLQMYYDLMNPCMQHSHAGMELQKEIAKLRAGSPGSVARDFQTVDLEGHPLSLSAYKGQYVLLDFWASWCVPCRRGNPHLKELYAKYKSRGIEFIGISDDDNKPDAWRKAVAKDSLPWKQVLRGLDWAKLNKGEENPSDLSELFGIHGLPTRILINREGKIVGRYDSDDAPLDQKLAEAFPDK